MIAVTSLERNAGTSSTRRERSTLSIAAPCESPITTNGRPSSSWVRKSSKPALMLSYAVTVSAGPKLRSGCVSRSATVTCR